MTEKLTSKLHIFVMALIQTFPFQGKEEKRFQLKLLNDTEGAWILKTAANI